MMVVNFYFFKWIIVIKAFLFNLYNFRWKMLFLTSTYLQGNNRKYPFYKTDALYSYAARDIICFLYAIFRFPPTTFLEMMTRMGELKDVSMKRYEATLIPRFIPRNRRSIICRSSLKTRLWCTRVHVQWIYYALIHTYVYCVNRRWRAFRLHDRNILKRASTEEAMARISSLHKMTSFSIDSESIKK